MTTKILAFAGSTRKNSFNKQLVKIAAQGARQAGAEVTVVDLADFPMPLFDEDVEAAGYPEKAQQLKELMKSHHGFIISSPEYNSSITAVLKNAIDWTSRKTGSEAGLAAFSGKTAAIISASPGALGGLRGLVHLRAILGNIGVTVIPESRSVGSVHQELVDGKLKDEKLQQAIESIGKRLAEVTEKLQH